MSGLFQNVLNLTPIVSVMILAVLVMRYAFKNAPKKLNIILWVVIGIRCLLPFSLSTSIGVLPNNTVPYTLSNQGIQSTEAFRPQIITPIGNPGIEAVNVNLNFREILPYIWILGMLIFLAYVIVSFIRVRILVSDSIPCGNNIYEADRISSSFVMGIINPRIYLKSGSSDEKRDLIIAHERCHIKNGDNFIKLISFIILGIYWFNPLMWVAFFTFCKDIELACDEEVIKGLPLEKRKDYAMALLESSHKKGAFIYGTAFNENDTKDRIVRVMNYKKAKFWVVCIAAVACVAFLAMFFTVNKGESIAANTDFSENETGTVDNESLSADEEEFDNPGYFETESISVKYDVNNFFGYMDGDSIVLNNLNAVAGTSLIQISASDADTLEGALSEIANTTGFELGKAEKYNLNGYNAIRVSRIIPEGEEGVIIDDIFTIAENNGKIIVIDEMVTRDTDAGRKATLEKEFSEALSAIRFI